ncbi:hypothetical protein [Azospirillum tabaci]|uniref:hypothetical protein n=1 Tax=Azospirillum tabaci TaxID=2752310 RepID=UPI0016608918|nr:hypothetical protein [Azospirillum tabaci]
MPETTSTEATAPAIEPSLVDLKAAAREIQDARDALNAKVTAARALGVQVTIGITYDTSALPTPSQPNAPSVVTVSAVLPLTD